MTGISEIEIAVAKLSRQDLSAFRDWFQEFDADAWDRQLEADVSAGRLDMLAEEALRDLREGRCTDLCETPHQSEILEILCFASYKYSAACRREF